jgi:hypothetical protein
MAVGSGVTQEHPREVRCRFLSLACFIVLALNADLSFAQIKYGPKVGLNFSELPNYNEYIIDQQIYNGYHFGAISEFRIFNNLFLQPGLLISNQGSEYIVGNNTGGTTTGYSNFQFSVFYADLPINLVYKVGRRSFKFLILAGPQIGFGLTGKWEATYGRESTVHFGNGPEDDMKPIDYGFNLGGGLEAGRFQITSQYYLGLNTISTLTPPQEEQKYKILTISIAYLFGKDSREGMDFETRYRQKYNRAKAHRK